jgi:endonuclease III
MKHLKMYEQYDMEEESLDPDMLDDTDEIEEGKDPEEITSKDTMRIEDIITKAGGDWNEKAKSLARQMAKAITDKYKAYRRGLAAENENWHEMARIFFLRAGQLGLQHH